MIIIDFRFVPVTYYIYMIIYATLCSTASPELFIFSSYFESAVSCQEQNSKRLEEISNLDTEAWEPRGTSNC